MKPIYQYIWALGGITLALSCQSAKEVYPGQQQVEVAYRNTIATDSSSVATLPWQEFFQDDYVKCLIEEGIANNLDLKIGLTRIDAAQAVVSQAKASFLPDVNVGGSLQRTRASYPQSFGFFKYATLHEVAATSTWELDIWGKLASSKRSAYYQLLKTKAAKQAIQTQLVAQIAHYYYELLLLDKQLRIVERTLENRAQDVSTMKQLKKANLTTEAAVVQSEANYLDAQITRPAIQKQIQEVENALSILLGRTGGTIERGTIEEQLPPSQMKVGVPAQLLQNRPDVRVEELALAAYFEDVKVAKRSFYPSITINASVGYSSYDVKEWFTPTGLFAQLTAGLLQPIFGKRQNQTKLAVAKATYQEQIYRFQQKVLEASKEVSNALLAYEIADEQQQLRQKQVEKLALAVDYTKKLMLYNQKTTYTDVLTSEQAYLYAELEMAHNELEKWLATIQLYRSLGGGWLP